MLFIKTKSYGPKISLTKRQEAQIKKQLNAAGLTCLIENCHTGSCYILIGLPEWCESINGTWFHDLYSGCSDDVAKIRMSGHDEGIRNDATHCAIGSKSETFVQVKTWIEEIIAEHSKEGLAIINNGPQGRK